MKNTPRNRKLIWIGVAIAAGLGMFLGYLGIQLVPRNLANFLYGFIVGIWYKEWRISKHSKVRKHCD